MPIELTEEQDSGVFTPVRGKGLSLLLCLYRWLWVRELRSRLDLEVEHWSGVVGLLARLEGVRCRFHPPVCLQMDVVDWEGLVVGREAQEGRFNLSMLACTLLWCGVS